MKIMYSLTVSCKLTRFVKILLINLMANQNGLGRRYYDEANVGQSNVIPVK